VRARFSAVWTASTENGAERPPGFLQRTTVPPICAVRRRAPSVGFAPPRAAPALASPRTRRDKNAALNDSRKTALPAPNLFAIPAGAPIGFVSQRRCATGPPQVSDRSDP